MKRNILYMTILFAGIILFSSCESDDPDQSNSIFNEKVERNSFDNWLEINYRQSYNIRVAYNLEDVETDFSYNVVPADIKKSKQMAILLKHLWLEAYTEVAADGVHFIRQTAPKLFHFIGSAEHDPGANTIRLGVAEGGKKITITEVNKLQPYNIVNQNYFNTVHHEFGHILHQTKNYPTEFWSISSADYAPTTWQNRNDSQAAQLGFVSPYASKLPDEDFVEVLARYITRDAAAWEATLTLAGENGKTKILNKLEIVRTYMRTVWGVDLDQLKSVVQRRANEIQYMDFDNLDF
ncbi:zinc-binding metallopeptidase [Dysgonomonas reticulitermitis]